MSQEVIFSRFGSYNTQIWVVTIVTGVIWYHLHIVEKSKCSGVEGLDGKVKIFFGRCLAFFCDAIGDHYIALRWFEASNGDRNVIDPIVLMPRLKEACPTAPASYGIMNVEALLNGALLIPNGDIFFALQSPREKDVYLAQNS